jgi:hypothetical protein
MRGLLGYFGEQRIAKVHIGQDRGKRISTSVMGKKEGGSPEDTPPASPREPIPVLRARRDPISPFFVTGSDQWLQRGPFDDLFRILEVESQLSLYYREALSSSVRCSL